MQEDEPKASSKSDFLAAFTTKSQLAGVKKREVKMAEKTDQDELQSKFKNR